MSTDLSFLLSSPFAHRGLHSPAVPENSMGAFAAAVQGGYAIELDVQVMADREVIVFHDANLRRMCGKPDAVDSLFVRDLAACRLKVDGQETSEKIPRLEEVLGLVDGRVPLLIEIKRQSQIKEANPCILNKLLYYKGAFAVQSFDPMILGWFARHAPHIRRGQLASDFSDQPLNPFVKYLLRNFKLNFISRPDFLAYDVEAMPRRGLDRRRRKGMIVLGWTIDSEACYERIKCHCDNIIFERWRPGLPNYPFL
jgi:glycerophosphoryl diester phosphodiesterase